MLLLLQPPRQRPGNLEAALSNLAWVGVLGPGSWLTRTNCLEDSAGQPVCPLVSLGFLIGSLLAEVIPTEKT